MVKVYLSKILFLVFASAIVLSCNTAVEEQKQNTASGVLDSMKLTDMEGEPLNMQQFRGKVLFINFWATWCKPCILEMPSIANAQKVLKENVVFILASPENAGETEAFRKENKYPFLYTRIENMESLGIQALPTTYIISSNGNLVFSEPGIRKWDDSSNIRMLQQIVNNE